MNIWSGSVSLNEKSYLRDLQLIDRSASWQSDILKGSTLRLRSFVNPALVPIYARVGPNLELHTTDPETSQWLKHKLLGNIWLEDDDLDCSRTIQCPAGFLVSLDGATRPRASGHTTTDLLVYGILSTTSSYGRPPTPPVSSSPETEETTVNTVIQELRIYGTPISGSLISKAQRLPGREDPGPIDDHEQSAQFLPDLVSPSPKRKRVATLFDSVAQHHKRVRHKGGEGVSLLMAQSLSQSSQQLQSYKVKREPEEPTLPILSKNASHRSRSLSISLNLNPLKGLETHAEQPRPSSSWGHSRQLSSRRGTPAPGPLDAPTKKERALSPTLLSSEGKEPPPVPKATDSVIADNKNTITRTILTCMRLYGFNRTTRPASSGKGLSQNDTAPPHIGGRDSNLLGDNMALGTSNAGGDEDEFKAMYHATYRASTFALRKYLREPTTTEDGSKHVPLVLEKAKAMTYIDGFLKLFCEEEH
ncbi:hypothetical protein BJY04DRAFT_125206 [Aspergillus karnatakaensis]|uniref:uncharacterized protein n=1 Tax=Aspergillus karnatakaensis TaxID=1810916 RepID=UPI003CCCB1A9